MDLRLELLRKLDTSRHGEREADRGRPVPFRLALLVMPRILTTGTGHPARAACKLSACPVYPRILRMPRPRHGEHSPSTPRAANETRAAQRYPGPRGLRHHAAAPAPRQSLPPSLALTRSKGE
jgi:hypothetical protein